MKRSENRVLDLLKIWDTETDFLFIKTLHKISLKLVSQWFADEIP